jgi:rRNA processing protein Krr1/Pno1
MGLLVNAAIAALAGSVGAILAATVISPTMSLPFGLLFGVLGFFLSKQLVPAEAQVTVDDFEARQLKKQQRKQKVAEKAKREREEAEAEAEAAAAEKAAEKAAKQKKKIAAKKKAAQVVDSESESEEEVVDTKNLSKSAQKKLKAKAKAKAAEDASSKLTEAQKKKEKEKAKAKAKADAEKAAKAEAKLRASIAADTEGWNTIESTKPAKKAGSTTSTPAAPTGSKSGKQAETPSSERPLTIEIIVPTKQHAIIIGPKGATLQQIQAGSGATIDMPKRETASSKINITGTPAQVAAAKNAIESLTDRGFSTLTHPGILSDEVTVDPKLIGLILGKNAETLRTIQSKTNTRINLPDKGTTAKTAKITIVGEKDGVKLAKATLKQLITDGFSPLTHEGYVKVDIVYPKERLGLLIGPNGQTIKSIQGNTKTRINIPDKTSNSQYVSVVGQPAGVAQAEKEILRLLEPPAPIPEPEESDLATEEAWGQQHTAQGEDALWE